ncbi:hypothetical protein KR067_003448 [Drosophila pandora]|nr:hypothetical protein KR067_003448 [Drosophila pandora]
MEDQYSRSYVKTVLHSLVVSSPIFMTIDKLQRDYRTEEGCNVPFARLGYKSLEGFLLDLPDTFSVIGRGLTATVRAVASTKSEHIQKFVQQQKKPSNKRGPGNRRNLGFHYQSNQRSDMVFINDKPGILSARPTPRSSYQPQVTVSCQPNYSRLQYPVNYPYQGYMQPDLPQRPLHPQRPPHPQPIKIHEHIPSKQKIPEASSNTAKIGEIVDSLSKLKVVHDTGEAKQSSQESLPDDKSEPKSPCSPLSDGEKPSDTESEIILKDPFNSDDEEPVAITASIVEKLDWTSSDEDEQAKQVPKTSDTKEEKKLIPEEDDFNGYSSSDDGMDENAIPAYAVDDRVLNIDYHVDAVRSGFTLPQRDMEDTIDLDDRIEVQLVRVDNPHQFYFWIYNNDIDSYKAMNSNMQEFYDCHLTDKYIMPLCLLTTGHLCVVRSNTNGSWQRAEVLRHCPGTKKPVEVKLIDTGHVMNVSYTGVKYLMKEFANLPAQCFIGRLAYVTPWKGHTWSADAVNFFYQLVCFRRLYAKIESIKDDLIYVVLVDPDSTEHTRNLNKALIDSGWVRRCYTC